MKNFEVARVFDLIADVLELRGDNPFRIRAYRRAARNLETLSEDVHSTLERARRLRRRYAPRASLPRPARPTFPGAVTPQ